MRILVVALVLVMVGVSLGCGTSGSDCSSYFPPGCLGACGFCGSDLDCCGCATCNLFSDGFFRCSGLSFC